MTKLTKCLIARAFHYDVVAVTKPCASHDSFSSADFTHITSLNETIEDQRVLQQDIGIVELTVLIINAVTPVCLSSNARAQSANNKIIQVHVSIHVSLVVYRYED